MTCVLILENLMALDLIVFFWKCVSLSHSQANPLAQCKIKVGDLCVNRINFRMSEH